MREEVSKLFTLRRALLALRFASLAGATGAPSALASSHETVVKISKFFRSARIST